jgi:ATP-dependent Clp protease adaptor protein ClpS
MDAKGDFGLLRHGNRWVVNDQSNQAGPERSTGDKQASAVSRPLSSEVSRGLPQFRVLLHRHEQEDALFVVRTIVELTPLSAAFARDVMVEAHTGGVAQVLITHKERAELYQEQFASKGLCVTIEPAA